MSVKIKEKNLQGSDLLPAIQSVRTEKALALSKIITEIVSKALITFKEGRFADFDAPVGDNSCKIRAVKIACIATRLSSDPCFREEIEQLLEKLASLRFPTLAKDAKTQLSLQEFRESNDLEFTVSPDVAFLIRAHFLFFTKKSGAYDQTDPSSLQKIANISQGTAKDWIHKVKEQLATSSVDFVREESLSMQGERKEILQKMLSNPFVNSYEKRDVLPNLHSMEVLFTRALELGLFVIFKTNKETLLFRSDPSRGRFIPKTVEKSDLNQSAIIIEGKIDKDLPFNKTELLNLLLIRASQDPQYLEGSRNTSIDFSSEDPAVSQEKERFEKLKSLSTPLHIDHILCDKVGNLLKVEELTHLEHSFKTLHVGSNWMGDDLNIPKGSWLHPKTLFPREVHY